MAREWMQALCKAHSLKLSMPFGIELDGVRWDCACDGVALLMLRGDTYPPPESESLTENVHRFIEEMRGLAEHKANFWDLMQWADPTVELLTPPGLTETEPLVARFYDRWANRRLVWAFLARIWQDEPDCPLTIQLGPTLRGNIYVVGSHWRLLFCPCLEPDEERGRGFPGPSLPNPDDVSMFELD